MGIKICSIFMDEFSRRWVLHDVFVPYYSFGRIYFSLKCQNSWCLDVASTHGPSTRSLFFPSRWSYRPAEGRVEAKRRQRPGPPPVTTNRLLAEPGGGPGVNCAWVKVLRGRTVGGRIVGTKTEMRLVGVDNVAKFDYCEIK